MSTYKEKLDYTEETKNLIKDSIVKKGVAVTPEDTFRSYAEKIDSIPAARPMGLIPIKTKDVWPGGNFADSIESIDWTEFNKAGVTSMGGMFEKWPGKTLDIANLSTTGVTNMWNMFFNCQNLTSLDLSHFDTSKVTNMGDMFGNCEKLTSLDVSSFDTSKVTSMYNMFYYCQSLTSLDLSKFDTSQVTDMSEMFGNCEKLTSLDLSNWNTSKVTSMGYMFNRCSSLTSLDVSHFDTSKVTNMEDMFGNCEKLTSIAWGNNWGSNPKLMKFDAHTGYSWSPSYSKLPKEPVLDLFNKLAVRDNNPVVNVEQKVYDILTPEEIAIATNKGWTVTRV